MYSRDALGSPSPVRDGEEKVGRVWKTTDSTARRRESKTSLTERKTFRGATPPEFCARRVPARASRRRGWASASERPSSSPGDGAAAAGGSGDAAARQRSRRSRDASVIPGPPFSLRPLFEL